MATTPPPFPPAAAGLPKRGSTLPVPRSSHQLWSDEWSSRASARSARSTVSSSSIRGLRPGVGAEQELDVALAVDHLRPGLPPGARGVPAGGAGEVDVCDLYSVEVAGEGERGCIAAGVAPDGAGGVVVDAREVGRGRGLRGG